jgi:DNA mismatch endonuclease, patch repair protein
MSKIRGSGNRSTELALIRIFREYKISGWRRNHPLFGKPDFAFPEKKMVVFVDGCFWHGCPKHGNTPKNNRKFWEQKIGANRKRDQRVNRMLRSHSWSVQRIWEHDIRNPEKCARKIMRALMGS